MRLHSNCLGLVINNHRTRILISSVYISIHILMTLGASHVDVPQIFNPLFQVSPVLMFHKFFTSLFVFRSFISKSLYLASYWSMQLFINVFIHFFICWLTFSMILFIYSSTFSNLDNEPPAIYCPQNMEVKKKSDTPAIKVYWPPPTYRDNSGQAVTIFTESINGSDFRTGSHPITYTATDQNNNKGSCTFIIVISCKFEFCFVYSFYTASRKIVRKQAWECLG